MFSEFISRDLLSQIRDQLAVVRRALFGQKHVIVILMVIAVVSYGSFYTPAIFGDDWSSTIEYLTRGGQSWIAWRYRRPFAFAVRIWLFSLFGMNIDAFYVVLGALHLVAAAQLYFLLLRFVPRSSNFPLVVAAIFVVHPATYTNMNLTMVSIKMVLCLVLLYAWLLLVYAEKGHLLVLGCALLSLLVAYGFYDAQLGVACVWPLMLMVVFRHKSLKRRLSLLAALVLSGIFSLWRTVGQPAIEVNDPYLSQLVLAPRLLLHRLLLGYKVSLGWAWTTPIEYLFPWLPGPKYVFLLLGGMALALWWLLRRFAYPQGHHAPDPEKSIAQPLEQRWSTIRSFALLSLSGLILAGAGYVPVIAAVLPNLSSFASRVNLFASPGSAIFLVSTLMIGALLFARNQQQVKVLFLASAMPFLLLSIATQSLVQYHTRIAWHEQKSIWQQLFSIAPDFEDETKVVLIVPDYQGRVGYRNWQRTPLGAPWEVSSAIRVLYDNPTLSATLVFPDIAKYHEAILTPQGVYQASLTPEGVYEPSLASRRVYEPGVGTLTTYKRSAFFLYDNSTGVLRQLDELPVGLVEGAITPIELDTGRVLTKSVSFVALRRLVDQ